MLYLYLPVEIELKEFKSNLLESMVAQVGMAIDNARLSGETKKMAWHDPLTELANHHFVIS